MDTNYLLRREQVSLMMARATACPSARHAHLGLARGYGSLLAASAFPHRRFDPIVANDRDFSENPDRGRADA